MHALAEQEAPKTRKPSTMLKLEGGGARSEVRTGVKRPPYLGSRFLSLASVLGYLDASGLYPPGLSGLLVNPRGEDLPPSLDCAPGFESPPPADCRLWQR